MLSPIILFVYNRPWHTEQTLNALMHNELAFESTLYIYCDGVKNNANQEQKQKLIEVRDIVRSKQWCKEVHIIESEFNKGLADSIISGVTEVINKYGKVIVLEDDIVTAKGFLKYMNDALDVYENKKKVMHISGYMYPHSKNNLPDTFFYKLPYPGGGWATWSRAWKYFNNETKYLYDYFEKKNLWSRFNTVGGEYLQSQLKSNLDGNLKTWFVKWHAILIIKKGYTLFPKKSLTYNTGFDGSGVHCSTTDRFNGEITSQIIVKKRFVRSSLKAKRIIYEFYGFKINYRHIIIKKISRLFPKTLKVTLKGILNVEK
jgi:hypothetical protein